MLCNDQDIPDSPYMANILPEAKFDASRVTAHGPGLEKAGCVSNKWAEFIVDTTKALAPAPTHVSCMDVDYNPVDVQVRQGCQPLNKY